MDSRTNFKSRLPSRHVTEGPERAPHRSYLYAMGLTAAQIHQPLVGVASCRNEAAPCNISLMRQAQAVKKGVASAASGHPTNAALHRPATAHERGIAVTLFDVAEVFKRTPCIADLKPGGRYVAKDMFEVGSIPLLMKTALDHGYLHGECMTVTGRTIAENLKSVKWNPNQDVVYPADKPITVTGGVVEDGDVGTIDVDLTEAQFAERRKDWKSRETEYGSGYLWKYAQQVGPAINGAVTHPGGAAEKHSYADA